MWCLKPGLSERLIEFVIDCEGPLMSQGSVKVVSAGTSSTCFLKFSEGLWFCGFEGKRPPGVLINKRHILEMLLVSLQASKQASKQSCLYGNCFRHNTSYEACAGAPVVQQTQTLDST